MSTRINMLGILDTMNPTNAAKATGIPRETICSWAKNREEILAYDGNKKKKKIEPGGRRESFPDPESLVDFVNEMRAQERALTMTHAINWIKRHEPGWLRAYLSQKKPGAGYDALLRLLQRFMIRKGFTRQRSSTRKHKTMDLENTRDEFAEMYHRAYHGFGPDAVYNVDETGFYYDMPPKYIWSVKGGEPKIATGEKHSLRMTAVLTVKADGTKLPILFIIRGSPGGRIASNELPTYPRGHFYAVQEKAWMNNTVWRAYLRSVLADAIDEPSVILLDNFESHVSDESYTIVHDELGSLLCPLPPNATSVCQPLDVGVMAPFKRYLRDEWLAEEIIDGEDGDDFDTPTAAEKRVAMIKRAILAWDRVSASEIRRSFEKAIPAPAANIEQP
ncbi:hypothetical protein AaE_015109 [Aphanomyces astaci]|uniref:DDE-1 domain-containing protein n=2 Tax=Aphanomyces astaci TaxID=112090 RepID=A0A6A4Z2R1_APHAT|nr:hypothetical protein AaE_015109 [Aphanomyces astaci]